MKKLNLKLFTITMFLTAFFVILPPIPILARGMPPRIVSPKNETIKAYLEQKGIYAAEINPNLRITPAIAAEIDKALKETEKLESSGISTITTNTPAELNLSNIELGKPIMVNPAGNRINGNGPSNSSTPIVVGCFYIVCVIVIAGASYYIIRKICTGLDRVLTNSNWRLTNNSVNYIAQTDESSTDSLNNNPTDSGFISSLITQSFPYGSAADIGINPDTVNNYSNILAYSFNIQEKSDLMSPWTTNHQFSFSVAGGDGITPHITGFRVGNVDLGALSPQFDVGGGEPVYVIRINETMKPMNFYKSDLGVPTIPYQE